MKNHLISLIVCLGFGFWCSYSSANYLDDQIRKYCIAFMDAYLGADLNYKITTHRTDKIATFTNLLFFKDVRFWECRVSKIDRTNNIKTKKDYTVSIMGQVQASESHRREEVSELIASHHIQHNIIPAGIIKYISSYDGELYNLYVAIVKMQSSHAVQEFYEVK